MTLRVLVTLLSILLVFACTRDNTTPSETSGCDTDAATYSEDVSAILNTSCAIPNCHNPGDNLPRLDGYDNAAIASESANFLGSMKGESGFSPMPWPIGSEPLDPCDIAILEAWVDAGVPQ